MAKKDRGFASMTRDQQREIASKGGRAAHAQGTAHEWTSSEAIEAGRKGGLASRRAKAASETAPKTAATETVADDDHVSRFLDEGNPHG